ncbi:MAG: hypothetical protein Q8R37_05075 [Nanoarchaeota archaeon]|nr:hypothetical protein [Nanoarchaeota archaeon]
MKMKELVASSLVSLALTGCSTNESIGANGYSCEREKYDGGSITYKVRQGLKSAELKLSNSGYRLILYPEKLWSTREEVLEALDACVENFKTYDGINEKLKK